MTFLADVFIVVFLTFAWSWNDPVRVGPRKLVRRFSKHVSWLGLKHGWSMFAPTPLHVDRHLEAEVCMKDGSVIVWQGLRFDKLTRWQAFINTRHRKFQTQILKQRKLRLAFAEYLARSYGKHGHAVQKVRVVRVARQVPGPLAREASPRPFNRTVLYTYRADGERG